MIPPTPQGRLSTLAAALVVARRDFVAILWSRSFIFFLLGPLFPIVVGALAGGITAQTDHAGGPAPAPALGVLMAPRDTAAILAAATQIGPRVSTLPDVIVVRHLPPGTSPAAALKARGDTLGAVLSGTPDAPVLTGPPAQIADWQGPVSLLAARAAGWGPSRFPPVQARPVAAQTPPAPASSTRDHLLTAQAGQTLLFLLTMLLAGMVLSNLVEEKGNKIIEVLAAAIPMDAVFLGKLFAMLAVSFVGLAVWGLAIGAGLLLGAGALPHLAAPAVGWPAFIVLGVLYFAMAYLVLGSVFLTIGSQASTVREVQTLNMPVTMLQLMVFFFASYALTRSGSPLELAAQIVPFSSPFAMLGRAAMQPQLWPHALALGWQALWVAVFVRVGARLFRRWVMKSGPQGARKSRRKPG